MRVEIYEEDRNLDHIQPRWMGGRGPDGLLCSAFSRGELLGRHWRLIAKNVVGCRTVESGGNGNLMSGG